MGSGVGFSAVSPPGINHPKTTNTGAVLTVQMGRRPVPILADRINRGNRVFLPRAPYSRISFFTRNAFTRLQNNESYVTV